MSSALGQNYKCKECKDTFHYKKNFDKHSCEIDKLKLGRLQLAVAKVEARLRENKENRSNGLKMRLQRALREVT